MTLRTEIVAEIGINHGNDLAVAHRLIDAAKDAGADAAKFQASVPELEVSRRAAPEHYELIKSLVPTETFLVECKRHCDESGIEFLCTPAEEESLAFLVRIGVRRIKVASDNLTNAFLLKAVDRTELPVILSTGMADILEIDAALMKLRSQPVLLHCTSAYPCPPDEANLKAIPLLLAATRCPVGWSDHTTSTELAAVAVGLGAVMIEKHLTFDTRAQGPDHAASLDPIDFQDMVARIRRTEEALGDGVKRLMPSEAENARVVRKSLVARRAIRAGEQFRAENLTAKRPGTGLSPARASQVLGRLASRDYQEDELIA